MCVYILHDIFFMSVLVNTLYMCVCNVCVCNVCRRESVAIEIIKIAVTTSHDCFFNFIFKD